MVSHPENGSDSPIGSNRDRGRDNVSPTWHACMHHAMCHPLFTQKIMKNSTISEFNEICLGN